jgi:hypothetical protein
MTIPLMMLLLALCVVAYRVDRRHLSREGAPIFAAFCFLITYSSAGQVLLYVLGNDIYFGIKAYAIEQVLLICIVAVTGLLASSWLFIIRDREEKRIRPFAPEESDVVSAKLVRLLLVLVTAVIAVVLTSRLGWATLPKDVKLAQAGSTHYEMLLVWQISFVVYLAITWRVTRLSLVCLVIFSLYCLLMSERDFVFAATAFTLVAMKDTAALRRSQNILFLGLFGSAVYLSAGRGGNFDSSFSVSALSQGSNLFVNSFVYDYVQGGGELLYGRSYLNALISTFSFGVFDLDPSLSEWLTYMYAGPNSSAGYGFSLEAEAYLNLGFFGVFLVFLSVGWLLCSALASSDTASILRRTVYVWVPVFLFYQVRQESLVVFKTLWLCVFVGWVIKAGAKVVR